MGVGARADQRVYLHPLAADLADQIAQDTEAGDGFDGWRALGMARRTEGEGTQAGDGSQGMKTAVQVHDG